MRRIFQALERGGALPAELVALLVAWRNEVPRVTRAGVTYEQGALSER